MYITYVYHAIATEQFHFGCGILILAEELAEEAFLTDMKFYQPLAEIVAAELKLAIGLHPRTANPFIRSFSSPAELWFYLKWVQSLVSLKDDGLLGEPKIIGKRQSTAAAIKQFDNFAELRFSYPEDGDNDNLDKLIEIFYLEFRLCMEKKPCNAEQYFLFKSEIG